MLYVLLYCCASCERIRHPSLPQTQHMVGQSSQIYNAKPAVMPAGMFLAIKPPVSSTNLRGSLQTRARGMSPCRFALRQSYTSRTVGLVVNAEIIWRLLSLPLQVYTGNENGRCRAADACSCGHQTNATLLLMLVHNRQVKSHGQRQSQASAENPQEAWASGEPPMEHFTARAKRLAL